MIHNDVLRRLRYALSLDDKATISLFALVGYEMEQDYLAMLMKKEDEQGFLRCRDKIISLFLDGLIIKKRGKREGQEPVVLKGQERLSNNEILRKIRIAMSYRDEDMLDILKSVNFKMSKNELSALFRKPDHRNYKECGDQMVRNFLNGMVKKYRPDATQDKSVHLKSKSPKPSPSKPRRSQKTESPGKQQANRASVWGEVKRK